MTHCPGNDEWRRGFSLVELLVASGIAALMMYGLTSSVVMGLTAWRRIHRAAPLEAAIALEHLSRDFASSFNGPIVPFQGESGRIVFASLAAATSEDGTPTMRFGKKEYFFDPQAKALCVTEQSYGFPGNPPLTRYLAGALAQLRLEYLQLDVENKKWSWVPSWSSEQGELPWGVRVTAVLEEKPGKEISYVKSIIRPAQP